MSTQPPYHTSTFGAPNQDPSTSTPIGTQVGAAPPTDPLTGPAPSTAGPHPSNMGNRLDPRVDSDLDNRAQYAPGATATGNAHPGTVQDSSFSHGANANDGPHRSSMMNKVDPRVDARTGETSTTTTNQTGYPAGGGYGAPGESHANPEHEAQYVPHGEQREHGTATGSSAAGSKSAQKGEQLGHSVKSLFAGVHGAGESLRGGLTAAVDKAFGHDEGAAKNADIASKGERQIQTGQFGGHGR